LNFTKAMAMMDALLNHVNSLGASEIFFHIFPYPRPKWL
jgi:hypothetical protein